MQSSNKMMTHRISSLLLILLLETIILASESKKILSLSFFESKSHKYTYEPLLTELANRGHSITVVTPTKSAKPHENITEIVGRSTEEFISATGVNLFEKRLKQEAISHLSFGTLFEDVCNSYYNMSAVQKLKNEKYDLIFVNSMQNECTYGLIHHLKAPFIIISPVSPYPWTIDITGTPSPPSFVPFLLFGFNDHMAFFERLKNFFGVALMKTAFSVLHIPKMEKVYRDIFGEETPSVREIQKNVSMILSNSFISTSYARPLMPDTVEVGGMACRPAKSLPKDLDDFLTGAGKDGFIYFSMGSLLKSALMPESYRKIFVNAFSKLKQRVIWKWDGEEMKDLPKNVKLEKWLPQQDILGHPNIKMFITHGGLGSMVEAVYHQVPLIGIPMFGDQDTNLKQSSKLGFSIILEFRDLNEETVLAAINEILNNPKYTQRVKELSSVYRDRPQNPLDTAVYWSEYVMRHNGAKHLRSPARDLNWFQYYCFDVVAFAATLLVTFIYVIYIIFKIVLAKCCGFGKNVSKAKKNN